MYLASGGGFVVLRRFLGKHGATGCPAQSRPLACVPYLLLATTLCWIPAGCGKSPPAQTPPTQSVSDAQPGTDRQQPAVAEIDLGDSGASPLDTLAVESSASTDGRQPPAPTASSSLGEPAAPTNVASAGGGTVPVTPQYVAPEKASPDQVAKWNIPEPATLQLLACRDGFGDGFLTCMQFTPDGKSYVVGGARLTLWNVEGAEPEHDFLTGASGQLSPPILCLDISPDGKLLAAGDPAGLLRIWDLNDRKELIAKKIYDSRISQIAFSPDSSQLATTSYAGDVHLHAVNDLSRVKSIAIATQELDRLLYISPTLLASSGGEATIWNLQSGEREQLLSENGVFGAGLALSADQQWIAYADRDPKLHLWNMPDSKTERTLVGHSGPVDLASFSADGKHLATSAQDSVIRIWDLRSGQTVQAIDAFGSRTVGLEWSPQAGLLVVASDDGRVCIWGTEENGKAFSLAPLEPGSDDQLAAGIPASARQLQQTMDLRAFPRLPDAVSQWENEAMTSYTTAASISEVEAFHRHFLGQAGWRELVPADPVRQGMTLIKNGCTLYASFTDANGFDPTAPAGDTATTKTQVSLNYPGNLDVRGLPQFVDDAQPVWESFESAIFQSKASLLDLEVALLKKWHAAGWTAYTRLNASKAEEVDERMLALVQNGIEVSVFIRRPVSPADSYHIQVGSSVASKALPIPADCGWIELDMSTDPEMVATTHLGLDPTQAFYDSAMQAQGWLARDAGRFVKDGKARLPFIRGQSRVVIRLESLDTENPTSATRILVGETPERSSWQMAKTETLDPATLTAGIQAADFPIPFKSSAKYNVDQKQIEFQVENATTMQVGEQYTKQLEALGWKLPRPGIQSDEYVFLTFEKEELEISLRVRGASAAGPTTASVDGDGLLWSKPLPMPPQLISYETWLRRHRYTATLERLDEYAAEMRALP